MSDKTAEERKNEQEQEIIQKMILGEITPDLIQSYRIIKNCVDVAISKSVFTAGDNALLVRAFDTLRAHINEVNGFNKEEENKAEKKTEKKNESKKGRPPRKNQS